MDKPKNNKLLSQIHLEKFENNFQAIEVFGIKSDMAELILGALVSNEDLREVILRTVEAYCDGSAKADIKMIMGHTTVKRFKNDEEKAKLRQESLRKMLKN